MINPEPVNFTASFLTHMKKKIFDNLGNPIETISYSSSVLNTTYLKPRIIIDIVEDNKMREPKIINFSETNRLEKYGLCVVTIPISKAESWYRGQKVRVALISLKDPGIKMFKKLRPAGYSGRNKITFKVDEANHRIKMLCPRVNPMGESEWVNY